MINATSTSSEPIDHPATITTPSFPLPESESAPTDKKTPGYFSGKKILNKKQLLGLVGLVILLVGSISAGLLSQLNNDIRNQAAGTKIYYTQGCIARYGSITAIDKAMTACIQDKTKQWSTTTCTCLPQISPTNPPPAPTTSPTPTTRACSNGQCQFGQPCTQNSDCANPNVCGSYGPGIPLVCTSVSSTIAQCGDTICDARYESTTICPVDCPNTPTTPPTQPPVNPLSGTPCQPNFGDCGTITGTVCEVPTGEFEGTCKLTIGQNCNSNDQCATGWICRSIGGKPSMCQPNQIAPPNANVQIRRIR
jgi:hypothetical protein